MLNTYTSDCKDCESIDKLLIDIDCELSSLTTDSINNDKFELGLCINKDKVDKLIKYKAILLKRRLNTNYLQKPKEGLLKFNLRFTKRRERDIIISLSFVIFDNYRRSE